MDLKHVNDKIVPILKCYGVKRAAVFGSFVRGEATERSDLDILVEIGNDISLLDFNEIKLEIKEALGKKVDLVEYKAIKPILRKRILKEEIPIL